MRDVKEQADLIRRFLAEAVAEALDRKRRLGQYAVVIREGKPYRLEPDQPRPATPAR